MRASAPARAPERPTLAFATSDSSAFPGVESILESTFATEILPSPEDLLASLEKNIPDAIFLDLDTIISDGEHDGLGLLRILRHVASESVLIAVTRSNARTMRLRAEQYGADEFFVAPIDFNELTIVLMHALEKRGVELENLRIHQEILDKYTFCDLVGGSEPMQRVYDTVRRVAPSNTTVVIRGESGTGKELVAKAIVAMSPRADKPFISVNCAALPENLIESELFGHEKGAFTGANTARPGHIELADTGTLFLDEIATLGLGLQSKLLRVLQDRAVQRIGSKSVKKIDFRLVTATNEDLEGMVQAGRFREDLYYRINVVPIPLPALRDRAGDIPLLADHLMRIYCTANDMPLKKFDNPAMEVLESHSWPGNVREMENVIQRLVLMVEGEVIHVNDLPEKLLISNAASTEALLIPEEGLDFDDEIKRIEIAYIQAAIRRTGKKSAAAQLLRIPAQKMKYLCRKYNL